MGKIEVSFNAGVEYNNKLYMSSVHFNGLFEYDLSINKLKFVACFSKEYKSMGLHRFAVLFGNEAWFIPELGNYISIVNLDTLEIEYIDIPNEEFNEKAEVKVKYYSFGKISESKIFLVPCAMNSILIIDMENKRIDIYELTKHKNNCYVHGYYNKGKIVLLPYGNAPVLEVDLLTRLDVEKESNYSGNNFLGVYFDNIKEQLWYAPGESNFIFMEDLNKRKIHEIKIIRDGVQGLYSNFIVPSKDYIFFCGWMTDKMICVNKKDLSIKYYSLGRVEAEHLFTVIYSQNTIIVSAENNKIYIYNKQLDKFDEIEMCIESDELFMTLDKLGLTPKDISGTDIYSESICDINFYLKKIVCMNQNRNLDTQTCGKKIWDYINSEDSI